MTPFSSMIVQGLPFSLAADRPPSLPRDVRPAILGMNSKNVAGGRIIEEREYNRPWHSPVSRRCEAIPEAEMKITAVYSVWNIRVHLVDGSPPQIPAELLVPLSYNSFHDCR